MAQQITHKGLMMCSTFHEVKRMACDLQGGGTGRT